MRRPPPPPAAPSGAASSGGAASDVWLPLVATLPILVAVVAALAHGWSPVGDQAGEVSRVADVGTRHTPLVGPYSRQGWSHPGPLLFWVCAPGWRLAGPAGVMATVGLVNAGAAALATALARRLAGPALAVAVTAALLAVELAIGPAGLVDVWNPYVGTIALATGLLAAAAVVAGADRALPVVVASLSWAVQAHVGAAPTAVAAGLAATVLLVVRRRWPDRRWLAAAALLGALAWTGPVVDQLTGDGNLRALASGLVGSGGPRPPLGSSLGYAAGHLGLVPTWVHGDESPFRQGPTWTLGVAPAGLALTALTARRRGDRDLVAASVITGAGFVAAVAATTRIDLVFAPYLYRWTWAVGAVTWAVIGTGTWRLFAGPRPVRRGVAGIVGGALVVAAVGISVTGVVGDGERVPTQIRSAATTDLLGQLDDLPDDRGYVIVVQGVDWGLVATGVGVGLRIEGYDVAFLPESRAQLGDHRVVPSPAGRSRLVVVTAPTFAARPSEPGATLVASHDPLTPAQRHRVGRLSDRIRAQVGAALAPDRPVDTGGFGGAVLVAQGGDPAMVAALADLTARGDRCTVWLVP